MGIIGAIIVASMAIIMVPTITSIVEFITVIVEGQS